MQTILIRILKLYKKYVSAVLPAACRFTPTCSEYAAQAIEKYGCVYGSWKGFKRICRCHPFHPGGHDPVR